MWRSSLIQSSLSAFLMLMLMFMLDFSFDYEIPSFRQGSIFLRRSMSMRARTEHGTPNIERRTSNAEPTLAQRKRLRLPISHLPSSIFQTLARVVEWQTRTFEGRMPKGMRVQVPPRAPRAAPLFASSRFPSRELGQDRFLHVQPVLRLIENGLRMHFESFLLDFLTPMRRQAMHHQCVGLGQFHERLVDPVRPQLGFATCFIALFAHRDPDIRVKHIGAARRLLQIFRANDATTGALQ